MTYLHPGVYIEEIPGSMRAIEAGGTSTAAFLGIAEKGPTDEAVRLSSWPDFVKTFGSFIEESYLAYAVYGFFANGGSACYVVRVNHGDACFSGTTLYTETVEPSLGVEAVSPGRWGNDLRLAVADGTLDGEFDLEVYFKGSDDPLEKFAGLSMTDEDPNYVIKRVNGVSSYITVTDKAGPDSASFTSLVDLAGGVNLGNVFNIHLTIDGESALINLRAGESPPDDYSEVSRDYIIDRINEVFRPLFGENVAGPEGTGEHYIRLTSPTAGAGSRIRFSTCDNDATEEVFGLVEYGWEKTGEIGQPTELLVPGVSDLGGGLSGTDAKKFKLAVDGQDPIEVTFNAPCSLATIVSSLNSPFGNDPIATTDGYHLILNSTDKYLSVSMELGDAGSDQRALLGALFGRKESGNEFYSYRIDPPLPDGAAVIESDADAAAKIDANNRYIRLKIDDEPALTIDVAEGFKFESGAVPSLYDLRDAINRQIKQHTSIKKEDVASTDGYLLTLISPRKGSRSRLVFSCPGKGEGTDATHDLFGSTLVLQEKYVFVAESRKETPAGLISDKDLADSAFNWGELATKKLRLAVSGCREGASRQFGFTFANNGDKPIELAKQINAELGGSEGVATLSYARKASEGYEIFLKLASPVRGRGSFLRFSDPLDANQQHDSTANALPVLFGESLLKSIRKQGYGYEFAPKTRCPKSTETLDDKLETIPLRGGWDDHENVEKADYFTAEINDRGGARIFGGVHLLDPIDDIRLLGIPMISRECTAMDHGKLIAEAMAFCAQRKDCFFIADAPPDIRTRDDILGFVKDLAASVGRDYAAIHYPWIEVSDPIGSKSRTLPIPPSGHLAGMYARTDAARGVWKAPAGVEAGIANAIRTVDNQGTAVKVNDSDQDLLNPLGVNCIRQFPGVGIVNWGARTLAVRTKPEWKYIPIRRTAIFLERSIFDGIQWAVFEPNNSRLWSALRLTIESFMNGLFRAGAFQGDKPSEAYFVRCGLGDTMTQVDIDLGRVIVLVGFAPLKPAEFVIVRIEQKAGQQ